MPNIQIKAVPQLYTLPRVTPGQSYDWLGGPQSEGVVCELHDRYYQQMYNGNVYSANLTTAAALPVATTTNGVQFAVWNPAGSGVQIVPIAFIIGYTSTAGAAGAVGYYYTKPAGAQVVTGGAVTAFTGITIQGGVPGVSYTDGQLPVRAGSAATVAVAGTLGRWSVFSQATPSATNNAGPYTLIDNSFQGSMIIRPDTLWYPAGNATTSDTFAQSLVFYLAPWP